MKRVIALGASNLTRGLPTVVSTARSAWGPDVQVIAALGHGRSYGASSTFLARRLPGILDSGLWRALESGSNVPTRALVTDVGNDILYGFAPEQVLDWVDESLTRLRKWTDDVVLTDLPMDSVRRLSRAQFNVMRALFAPSCRLTLAESVARAERVNDGLAKLAASHSARFLRLQPSWYGFDPIHIKPSLWQSAWQEILGATSEIRSSRVEALRLYLTRPEQQWLFGIERRANPEGTKLPRGAHVWLY